MGMIGKRFINIINLSFESTIYWLYDLGINSVTTPGLIVAIQQIVMQILTFLDSFVIACFRIWRV